MDVENISTIKDMMSQFLVGLDKLKKVSSAGSVDIGQPLTILQNAFSLFQGMVNEELMKIKERMGALEERQDKLDQYSRRNCLLFRGLHETEEAKENEDSCLKMIMNVMQNQLRLDLPDTVVERCHRLGSKKPDKGSRPIIVKFCSYRYRRQVFTAKRALKDTGVVVTEFLTQSRLQVLSKARELHGAHNTWTSDGKVHIKIPVDGGKEKRVVVTQLKEIPTPASSSEPGTSNPNPSYADTITKQIPTASLSKPVKATPPPPNTRARKNVVGTHSNKSSNK